MRHSIPRTRFASVALLAIVLLVAGGLPAVAGDHPDDGVMQRAVKLAKVRLALLENVGADAMRIDIDVVALSGHVEGAGRRQMAITATRDVSGVKQVRDLLRAPSS